MDECEMFNVGRATHWAFADGLGVNPKAAPETIGLAVLVLRQVARPSLCQGTSRGIFYTLDIAPTTDFKCTKCHGGLWSATSLETGPSGLRSNARLTRLTRPNI